MDVNLPKFTAADTPLFVGILSDLFPGLVMPEADYGHLKQCMREQAQKLNIQIIPAFEEKTILLYEMFQVRHGLCVCGQANSGKSMAFKCLAGAMTRMNKYWGLPEEEKGGAEKVEFVCINPKSVKMGQLYGDFDPVSLEWTDGELAIIFRNYSEDPSPNRKWVIFDGPVDAIWIENMNTVLDDNKKLCLNSGEIIKMTEITTMCFEVGDLKEASPATVSRIGVIFMEPASMGYQCSIDSWLERMPVHYVKHVDFLRKCTEYLIPEALRIWKYELSESTETQDIWLVHSCLKMWDAMAPNFRALNDEGDPVDESYATTEEKTMESIMVFCCIWSMGATTDSDGRVIFNDQFTDFCKGGNQFPVPNSKKGEMGRKLMCPFNEKGSVYDNVFNVETNKWQAWESIMEPYQIAPDASFQEMVIPTLDSTRYGFILRTMFLDHKPVLFAGETGTGKTVVVKTTIAELDQSKFDSIEVNFSAQTTCNMTQRTIYGKMEKRRKGVYGPLPGKHAIIFVDDLNMPAKETYGAQPPIEILRQYMDHGGWYDLDDL
jgi:dynein heavy chain